MKDRLRSRADEDYDALEDELLALAQTAMTSRTFRCSGCRRRNTIEVVDAGVRLRAIEAVLDRVGASRARATDKPDADDFFSKTATDWAAIQKMPLDELIRLRDFEIARDAGVLEETLQRQRDYEAIRAEVRQFANNGDGLALVPGYERAEADPGRAKPDVPPRSRPPPSPPDRSDCDPATRISSRISNALASKAQAASRSDSIFEEGLTCGSMAI